MMKPFAGQDPVTINTLLYLIRNLNEILGATSIIVSHDIDKLHSIVDIFLFFV